MNGQGLSRDVRLRALVRRRETGFTLIEVTAAAFVLAITVVGLAAALANGSRLSESPREEMAVQSTVRGLLADITSTPWANVASTWQGRGFDVPGVEPMPDDPDGQPGEIRFEYGPGGNTYYTLTLRVRWRGINGERTIESIHYLANVRGDSGTPVPLEDLEPAETPDPPTTAEPTGGQ